MHEDGTPLKIRISKKENYSFVVDLAGSLDFETHEQLDKELKKIIGGQTKAVVFDMGKVDYISSAGIGLVLKTKKALEDMGATFAMISLQPQIKKVFDVMKLLPIIDIFNDMPEAEKYIDQIINEELRKGQS
jgi:anti-anti-sigma factor